MAPGEMRKATFYTKAFEVESLEAAMRISLTPEYGSTTEQRWTQETAFLVDDIGSSLAIGPETVVLDYGCGPGRISKGLIDKYGCRAIGIDTSSSMRLLAPEYVLSERFTTWSPAVLEKMIAKGFRADVCVSMWVIQHVASPWDVIGRMDRALKPSGMCYILNQQTRCIPTDMGWADDGFDVPAALAEAFIEHRRSSLPDTAAPWQLARQSVIQVLRKKPS